MHFVSDFFERARASLVHQLDLSPCNVISAFVVRQRYCHQRVHNCAKLDYRSD